VGTQAVEVDPVATRTCLQQSHDIIVQFYSFKAQLGLALVAQEVLKMVQSRCRILKVSRPLRRPAKQLGLVGSQSANGFGSCWFTRLRGSFWGNAEP
jgi:hypothetical protein